MMCRVGVAFALLSAVLSAQPRFEVAAIKPTPPDERRGPSGGTEGKGRYSMHNRTLKDYIWRAWLVIPERVAGGPDWVDADRWDIEAKAEQPVDDDEAFMAMLRTLLQERFQLKVHWETRPGESLILAVSKDGPKLTPGESGKHGYNNAHARLEATNLSMGEICGILSRNLKSPVVDQTGLTGAYSFTLQWNPGPADVATPEDAPSALRSEVAKAMAAQLGLRLENRRRPVQFLVIDGANWPTAN
jgi:uncharacterized protein (TIGR03435 family)